MKDIHEPLRSFYYLKIAGLTLACYENGAVPDNAPNHYVIIADTSTVEDSNKSDFGNRAQVLLDIVTKFELNQIAGSKTADAIASKILAIINSKAKLELVPGLQIINTKVIQDTKTNSKSDTHRIYRRLIRFQHLIMEV